MNHPLNEGIVPINVPEGQGVVVAGVDGVNAKEAQSDGAERHTLPVPGLIFWKWKIPEAAEDHLTQHCRKEGCVVIHAKEQGEKLLTH